ncbi:hypothetical protein CI102_15128 [Trichoderma harzianum]|nr:hypothetical protein CI102_15128 [Trichoderma harzianum]
MPPSLSPSRSPSPLLLSWSPSPPPLEQGQGQQEAPEFPLLPSWRPRPPRPPPSPSLLPTSPPFTHMARPLTNPPPPSPPTIDPHLLHSFTRHRPTRQHPRQPHPGRARSVPARPPLTEVVNCAIPHEHPIRSFPPLSYPRPVYHHPRPLSATCPRPTPTLPMMRSDSPPP